MKARQNLVKVIGWGLSFAVSCIGLAQISHADTKQPTHANNTATTGNNSPNATDNTITGSPNSLIGNGNQNTHVDKQITTHCDNAHFHNGSMCGHFDNVTQTFPESRK